MKTKLTLILPLFIISFLQTFSQLQSGSIAPDFTLTAHNPTTGASGVTYKLYDILNSGKAVIIDFFYPNCGPCMDYHNTHALEKFYKKHGPGGDNTAMVFQINNNKDYGWTHIKGDNPMNFNWVNGISYPTISLTASSSDQAVLSGYSAWGTPTVYKICKDKKIYQISPLVSNSGFPYPPTPESSAEGLEKWMFDTCKVKRPNTTSINDSFKDVQTVFVYPNPSRDRIFVKGSYSEISIYDNIGKLVFHSNQKNLQQINTSNYQNGVYIIQIRDDINNISTQKLIINR